MNIRKKRRWTSEEVETILNYLLESGDAEKPTAKEYYQIFTARTQLDVPWNLVKEKVRHLKDSYRNAEKWLQSLGAEISEDDQVTLKTTCPHYDKLKKIFGQIESNANECASEFAVINSEFHSAGFTIDTLVELRKKSKKPKKVAKRTFQSKYDLKNLRAIAQQSADSTLEACTGKKRKKSSLISSTFIAALTHSQEAENANQRFRLKFEKEKFLKEFEFNKEKFKIEAELKREAIELQRSQMQREDKFKILELESNERIAKYELELKYKSDKLI